MIHQLILSTIFACTNKTTESTKIAVPPTPPETVSTESKTTEDAASDTDQASPTLHPDFTEKKAEAPLMGPTTYKGKVLVEHIINIQKSNQEINCRLLCQQSLHSFPLTQDSYQVSSGSYLINSCSDQLIENWEEQSKQGDVNLSVGEVTCGLTPKSPPRVIKGRAPLSGVSHSRSAKDLASYFARQAQEEAISIFSFAELHDILCAYHAPENLQQRSIKALREEQLHTRMAIALCEQYGGTAPAIQVPTLKSVSLFEATLHNALVGCIQETWAAVLEEFQAQHTQKHNRVQHRIAKDEISHAQLAWDIHSFFMSMLSDQEQSSILESMETFLSSHDCDILETFPGSQEIGIPSINMQKELYSEFSQRLQERIRQAA